jgi:hypothetical protein
MADYVTMPYYLQGLFSVECYSVKLKVTGRRRLWPASRYSIGFRMKGLRKPKKKNSDYEEFYLLGHDAV